MNVYTCKIRNCAKNLNYMQLLHYVHPSEVSPSKSESRYRKLKELLMLFYLFCSQTKDIILGTAPPPTKSCWYKYTGGRNVSSDKNTVNYGRTFQFIDVTLNENCRS